MLKNLKYSGAKCVLIVSDLVFKDTNLKIVKPKDFLKSSIKDFIVNLQCDNRYMKIGYYVSMHAEILGDMVMPTCSDILDVYHTPILLLRSLKKGIPTSPYFVTNDVKDMEFEFDFPMVVFPVNPFSHDTYRIVRSEGSLYRATRSLGIDYHFPVCVEPLLGEVQTVKTIFGSAECEEVSGISEQFYKEFRIPFCKLYIQRVGENSYLSGASRLRDKEVDANDLQLATRKIGEIV